MARRRGQTPRSTGRRWAATLRWTERDAKRALEAWRASGLSLPAWCRREGVRYERMRRWRVQLAPGRRPQRAALLPVVVTESERTERPGFELEHARGWRLHVPSAFDEASLARLLRVVETSA